MMQKKFGCAALVAAAALAFSLGSTTISEAKAKKMAAPPPQPQPCLNSYEPVCGAKGGMQFTYANACSAYKDGANVVAKHACAVKAKKHAAKKHAAKKKAMKKAPAKKAAKKKM